MSTAGTLQGIGVRAASRAPLLVRHKVVVRVAQGIVEDYGGSGLRQVTFISAQQWHDVIQELGIDLPWHTRRANLLIAGLDLPSSIGQRLQIGACLFRIHGETEPCQRMDDLQPGLRQILQPTLRGGVWGRVVQGGILEIGGPVFIV
jgi:MOSC domain-containing protein YiiM